MNSLALPQGFLWPSILALQFLLFAGPAGWQFSKTRDSRKYLVWAGAACGALGMLGRVAESAGFVFRYSTHESLSVCAILAFLAFSASVVDPSQHKEKARAIWKLPLLGLFTLLLQDSTAALVNGILYWGAWAAWLALLIYFRQRYRLTLRSFVTALAFLLVSLGLWWAQCPMSSGCALVVAWFFCFQTLNGLLVRIHIQHRLG